MSHSPPIPPGNQSPYPKHEAPHGHADAAPPPPKPGAAAKPDSLLPALIVGAVLAGAAATGLAFLFRARRPAPAAPTRRASKPTATRRRAANTAAPAKRKRRAPSGERTD